MKRSTFIGILMACCVGWGLFQLKYEVMSLEQKHRTIRQGIKETHEAIHVLTAEWAHLNDPNRLQQLSEKHLEVEPIQGSQIVSFRTPLTRESYNEREMDQLVSQLLSDDPLTLED